MSRDADRLELVSRLSENAAVEAAIEEIKSLKEGYYANFARSLSESGLPVDQRDVDYKRGFWRGALWAYAVLPKKAHSDLNKEIERALAEREGDQ